MDMQIFLTILSGTSVFVLGQVFLKMVIEPAYELKKTIAKVKMEIHRRSFEIKNFTVITTGCTQEQIEILRKLSAELLGNIELVLCYKLASIIFNIPNKHKINDASINLVKLVNIISLPSNSATAHNLLDTIPCILEKLKENLDIHLITD